MASAIVELGIQGFIFDSAGVSPAAALILKHAAVGRTVGAPCPR